MANLSTENIGTNYKGILNLGSTINTPLSTTLQNITDGDGNASPLKISTLRIALGVATGTGLLNFPDAGTTAADGISFGANYANLYRSATNTLKSDAYWNFTPPTLTGSSATPALSISQTYNTTGSPSMILMDMTNTASGSNTLFVNARVGGSSVFSVARSGAITSSSTITGANLSAAGNVYISGFQSSLRSNASGVIQLQNTAENDFNRLQWGGSTASFPSIKRNSANLQVRLADDSGFTFIEDLYRRAGSGSPEGVVTAPVGATYHNTTGGAGTSFYVKESGTGNTGWVAK